MEKTKKPFYKKWWFIAIVVIIVLSVIFGGNDKSKPNDTKDSKKNATETESQTETEPQTETEVAEVVDIAKMMEDLNGNAMNAKETYQGKYIEITGEVANIDSDGAYFTIKDPNVDLTFDTIQIFTNKDNKSLLSKLSKGSAVTVIGRVKDVGEIMGYTMDLETIK